MAPQLTVTNGPFGAVAAAVQLARDQLLAGAGLARDEHVDVGGGDLLQLAEHLQHRRAAPMISPKRLSFSSARSFSLSARSAVSSIAFCRISDAWAAKICQQLELRRSNRCFTSSLPTYSAPITSPWLEQRRAHHARELERDRRSRSCRRVVSVRASLTITRRRVSITCRTMLSLMTAGRASNGFALHVPRGAHARHAVLGVAGVDEQQRRRGRAPVSSMTRRASPRAARRRSGCVIKRSLNACSLRMPSMSRPSLLAASCPARRSSTSREDAEAQLRPCRA